LKNEIYLHLPLSAGIWKKNIKNSDLKNKIETYLIPQIKSLGEENQ
jgi:hypothetical protein